MSKQKRKRQQERRRQQEKNSFAHRRRIAPALIVVALLTALGAGVVLGPWKTSPVGRRIHSLLFSPVPTPTVPPPGSPSKEYIYAGNRLIATEEGNCLSGYSGTPYLGTAWPIPGVVQAENYDQGGEGVAFHDSDPWVVTGAYRPDGIYLENCSNPVGGCNVGSTWPGEWMRYSINVTTAGTFKVEVLVASGNGGGGSFHIEVDCVDVTGPMTVPNTGGWQAYQLVSKSGVGFTAGPHLMKLVLDASGPSGGVGNFNYLTINQPTTGSPPSNLVATTLSSTPSATQVSVTWSAAPGVVDHYEVERSQRINDAFTTLGPNPTTTSFIDTSAINGNAYLYRVRAVFSGGGISPYSNIDLATAISFDDDPIIRANDPQGRPATTIRALHLIQLHAAIDAVRYTAQFAPASWKNDPAPQSNGAILAIHFSELRTFLNPALNALGMTTLPSDSGIAIGQPIMATHVQDVREKLR